MEKGDGSLRWKGNVALFLAAQAITLTGSSLVSYAIMWHVTLVTGSGVMMTVFVFATMLPIFIMSPFGGVWSDRYNRKHLINLTDGAIAAISLLVAILYTAGMESILLLFACAVIRSAGQGVQMPAVTALIPQIAPKEHLVRVNGINASIQSLSMLGSPAVAGILMSVAPLQTIFYIDVVTAAIGISVLYFLVKAPTPVGAGEAGRVAYLDDIKSGVSYIKGQGFIRRFIIIGFFFNLLIAPPMFLSILQVTRDFGPDVWRLSAVEVTFSAGMLGGGILIAVWGGFRNKTVTCILGIVVFGTATAGLGLAEIFGLYLFSMAVAGLSVPLFNTPVMTIFQTKTQTDYLGRVMSVMTMISSVTVPLGMLVFGPLGDVIPIDWIMLFGGGGTVLMGLYIFKDKLLMEAGK